MLDTLIVGTYQQAPALSVSDLVGVSNVEASASLKTALKKRATAAIALLGGPGGFLGNPKVRIPLPGYLEEASKLLRYFGQSKRIDELATSINRATEAAVPMGKDLLVSAMRGINVNDAKRILTGGDDSVTRFLIDKTRGPLAIRFLPKAAEEVGLANQYNQFADKASDFGLVKKKTPTFSSV